jgi:hypothetical protein
MPERPKFEREVTEMLKELLHLARRIESQTMPRLTSIEIAFSLPSTETGDTPMSTTPPPSGLAPVAGPVILTSVGENTIASILGFDQFGNPWTGAIPPVTYVSSDAANAIITSTPAADGVTDSVAAVGNGVANLTASLTTVEGLALTDTETVTVALTATPPPPTPVLSSIKIAFQ